MIEVISGVIIVAVMILLIWRQHEARRQEDWLRQEEERRKQEEQRRLRRESLIAKYGEQAADNIIAHKVWQGMTSEQLTESWGHPDDVDTKVYKQKIKETWKYRQIGKNRYSQKVFTENGVVIGWQD